MNDVVSHGVLASTQAPDAVTTVVVVFESRNGTTTPTLKELNPIA
jgi:hypothetical protein